MTELLIIVLLAVPTLGAMLLAIPRSAASADRLNRVTALVVCIPALVLCTTVLTDPGHVVRGRWFVVDPAGAVFLAVITTVGLLSALATPAYLAASHRGFFTAPRARSAYYIAYYLFWATLMAVAIVDNLAVAWVLIEATTAASALLVAFSGRPSALEAGWKYLVLTSLGLGLALLGIIVLYASLGQGHGSLATLDWPTIHRLVGHQDARTTLLALVLILGGLATKIGWAPVHNWLPDAHSEAPPPISAMLSAALLPTVMLIAWRVQIALRPATGGSASALFLGFGLASLAVAVPFLWQQLPIKRLLAYSSLEHMGILAIGMGFVSPLASAGVLIHVAGHALAKSLGFYATIPLLRDDPSLYTRAPKGLMATSRPGAGALAVSLLCLSGLPPSPLFFSELLILLGGLAAGQTVVVAVAAVLLALGFLGLAHALIEGIVTDRPTASSRVPGPDRVLVYLTGVTVVALLALSASVYALPGSRLITSLMGAVR